jgi:hypothetical protein
MQKNRDFSSVLSGSIRTAGMSKGNVILMIGCGWAKCQNLVARREALPRRSPVAVEYDQT